MSRSEESEEVTGLRLCEVEARDVPWPGDDGGEVTCAQWDPCHAGILVQSNAVGVLRCWNTHSDTGRLVALFLAAIPLPNDTEIAKPVRVERQWAQFEMLPHHPYELFFFHWHSTKILRATIPPPMFAPTPLLGHTGGLTVVEFGGHRTRIRCIAVDEKGEWLASGSEDGALRVWRVDTTEQLVDRHAHEGPMLSVHVLEDKVFTAGVDHQVIVFHVHDGSILQTFLVDRAPILAFASPAASTRRMVAGGSAEGTLYIWDANELRLAYMVDEERVPILSLSFSSRGDMLVVGTMNGVVRCYETEPWDQISEHVLGDGVVGAAFDQFWRSPDEVDTSQQGLLFAACQKGHVRIWRQSERGDESFLQQESEEDEQEQQEQQELFHSDTDRDEPTPRGALSAQPHSIGQPPRGWVERGPIFAEENESEVTIPIPQPTSGAMPVSGIPATEEQPHAAETGETPPLPRFRCAAQPCPLPVLVSPSKSHGTQDRVPEPIPQRPVSLTPEPQPRAAGPPPPQRLAPQPKGASPPKESTRLPVSGGAILPPEEANYGIPERFRSVLQAKPPDSPGSECAPRLLSTAHLWRKMENVRRATFPEQDTRRALREQVERYAAQVTSAGPARRFTDLCSLPERPLPPEPPVARRRVRLRPDERPAIDKCYTPDREPRIQQTQALTCPPDFAAIPTSVQNTSSLWDQLKIFQEPLDETELELYS